MESKETVVRSGFSLFSIAFILALVFFILKVTNVLAWSWVWILSLSGFMRPLRLGFSFCSFSFFSFALSLPPQSSQDGGENTTSKNGGRKVAIFLH